MAEQGMRGTGSYSSNQRPTNFKGKIKTAGSRVTREDVAARIKKMKRGKKKK